MIVDDQVTINGSRAAIWAVISDIEHAAEVISGIQSIEVVERGVNGLVGLRWRETRLLFGKPAAVEKWVTDAAENEYYRTRAESDGFVFFATRRISETVGGVLLIESHEFRPQSIGARMQSALMGMFFRGVVKKALRRDLSDIKVAVERQLSRSA